MRGPHAQSGRRPWLFLIALLGFLLALAGGGRAEPAAAQAGRPAVHVLEIRGEIDLGLAAYVTRALAAAERAGAAAVIIHIDTFGGRVDAAVTIRDALLGTPMRTVAYVDRRAISAGALIALSAGEIVMAEGATIGAASPVEMGPEGARPAGEKATSYVRKEFRATAEIRGRPPELAEAMVDADVEVPGVVPAGKLLTLTTGEAIALGVADRRAASMDALLDSIGLAGAEVVAPEVSWAERWVRFLTRPAVSSLLLAIGTLGVFVELRTPGFGVPGVVGLAALALFFWAHWLVRLVGWEEVLLIGAGVVLLAIEAFVTPGFGAPGVLGILALLAGVTLSLIGAPVTWGSVALALGQVALAIAAAIAGALALLRLLPKLPFGRRLVLAGGLGAEVPAAPAPARVRAGDRGVSTSPLRPAGVARFGEARVDVVSEGGYVEAGEPIEVIRVEGSRVVVRQAAGGA
ncbi:MAG: nodulation protein NfeD [Polyangiaceae bacterium]|nr:nodulation protein NfeD [Polyangiaceae bacterium]